MADVLNIAEPREYKPGNYRLDVMHKGKRRTFYSSATPARKAKNECRRKALEWLEYLESGAEDFNISFADAWKLFLNDYYNKNKETSARQIESRGKAHLVERFKHTKLRDITKTDWQKVITSAYRNKARSYKTLSGIATTITTFCKWAAAHGYISDTNVPLYFDFPTRKTIKQKSILQPEQLSLLFSDDSTPYIHAFRFLALTGLRRGEFCALQTARDYDGSSIYIHESISHEEIITSGKTAQANRRIFLMELAKEQITAHRAIFTQPSKYLFPDKSGGYIKPRHLSNMWRKWARSNGMYISLHELRHTFISYSRLKSDITLEELKHLYGHSKGMNTDATYVHAIDMTLEEKREWIKKQLENAEHLDSVFNALMEKKDKTNRLAK